MKTNNFWARKATNKKAKLGTKQEYKKFSKTVLKKEIVK
jgi:hypothetical protein